MTLTARELQLLPQRLTCLPLWRAWRAGGKEQGVSSGKALVSSERAIPRRPLRVPRAILSLRDVLATRRTGCRCLPVGSFPRRNESRGDSLQKPACQPPFFFLSQQRYGNRGELEACQSSSPLIPPVQTNHRGFALSFPRLLSLLGLAGVSLLSLKLPLATTQGRQAAWVICGMRRVIFACAS